MRAVRSAENEAVWTSLWYYRRRGLQLSRNHAARQMSMAITDREIPAYHSQASFSKK